ncbi:nSTAND1 domain-containing NTPase [Streptomyces capoamus]|uniref:nSTAND1 domain-containing NTPase n=1 Tax=Streptomyces capoamus TaxID=68183 RepID=UPI003EBF1E3A
MDLLLTARHLESRLRVLLAVRADFYGRCAEHASLASALRDANALVGPMSPTELRAAIVRPAASDGLTVERALTSRLVDEVADAPGGLPLQSHVLLETWRAPPPWQDHDASRIRGGRWPGGRGRQDRMLSSPTAPPVLRDATADGPETTVGHQGDLPSMRRRAATPFPPRLSGPRTGPRWGPRTRWPR